MPDDIEIPAAFWQGLSRADFADLVDRKGRLTRGQTIRVYQLLGRMPEPGVLTVYFRKEDLLRAFPTRH